MKRISLSKGLVAAAFAIALIPAAHADGDPFWSLAIGVPGLIGQIGNAYPVAPPVYAAPPPVQYVPAPTYYAVQPYAPAPQYPDQRFRRWHGDHRDYHHEDHGDGGDR